MKDKNNSSVTTTKTTALSPKWSSEEDEPYEAGYEIVRSIRTTPFTFDKQHAMEDDQVAYSTPRVVHEITIIPVADQYGHLLKYPGQQDHEHQVQEFIQLKKEKVVHPLIGSAVEVVKSVVSMTFLLVSAHVCTAAMWTQQTVGTMGMSDMERVAFVTIFWLLILWLAEMEGSQSCLVGLQPVNKQLYQHSHPHAYQCASLAHQGDNMERFIVGRQFLIVLLVFVTNMMAFPVDTVSVVGVDDRVTRLLLGSGISVTALAVMLGQAAQINAANCMLDFVNTIFGVFTTYMSLFFDATGLFHTVYLVQIVFATVTGKPIDSAEPARTWWQEVLYWGRIVFSVVTLGYFCAITLSALYHGETTMWAGVSDWASVLLLIGLLIFVGILEGLQIALFAVVNLPADEMAKHKQATKCCDLTFSGNHLQAFLVGRQLCVTLCMFIVARITSCNVQEGQPTVFGVTRTVQTFFNTGLPGAVITTVIGSLAWRVIASSFPVAFLDSPLIYSILQVCLVVEASGVCSAAWLLAVMHKRCMGYHLDEVYIGTAEERAKNNDHSKTGTTSKHFHLEV